MNENVPRALYKVRRLLGGWEILHQSGEADLESTRELYRKFDLEAQVEAFWPDLPVLLSGSSLAICRAGGTTLAELAAAATRPCCCPIPTPPTDHQRKNADIFAAAGAAHLADEREITGRLDDHLAELLGRLLIDADGRAIMAQGITAWHDRMPQPTSPRSSGRWSAARRGLRAAEGRGVAIARSSLAIFSRAIFGYREKVHVPLPVRNEHHRKLMHHVYQEDHAVLANGR